MHHNISGEPLANFLTSLDLKGADRFTPEVALAVPEFAQPRGLNPDELPPPPAGVEQALAMGFRIVGRGVIERDECDDAGILLPHIYIGRISDGMPNLWAFMNGEQERSERESGALGGAALEQRLTVHQALVQGTVFTQLSGVRALG